MLPKLQNSIFAGRHRPASQNEGAGKKMPVALFIGRFQPFHKGHLFALRFIAKRSSRVLVVIGSAQCSNEPKNPFSAKERGRMIAGGLKEAGLGKKCRICNLDDINDDARWVAHVDASVPAYDICFSNNALVLRLMKLAGKDTSRVPFFAKEKYNATKIRQRMRARKGWRERVPRAVGRALERLDAEERMGRMQGKRARRH